MMPGSSGRMWGGWGRIREGLGRIREGCGKMWRGLERMWGGLGRMRGEQGKIVGWIGEHAGRTGEDAAVVARSQQKKIENVEKDAQPEQTKRKIEFSDLRNPQKSFCRRCLARSQNLGDSQKKKNNRVATATNLSAACLKTPSKVRDLSARDLCAPEPQRKGNAQRRTKESEHKQNRHKQHHQQWPPRRKYVTCHATPKCAATKSTTKTAPARRTNKG